MIGKWINKTGNNSCILFFNGWGMDENIIKDMNYNGFDVYMFFNYSNFDPCPEKFKEYTQLYLVAWSLGVCFANNILKNSTLTFQKCIAINATPYPMHDKYGIPESVFTNTLNGWNERNRSKFNLRMFGGKDLFDKSAHLISNRSIESQLNELRFFYNNIKKFEENNFIWNCVISGNNDLVIPYNNQLQYWSGKIPIHVKEGHHFLFSDFKSWKGLINIEI